MQKLHEIYKYISNRGQCSAPEDHPTMYILCNNKESTTSWLYQCLISSWLYREKVYVQMPICLDILITPPYLTLYFLRKCETNLAIWSPKIPPNTTNLHAMVNPMHDLGWTVNCPCSKILTQVCCYSIECCGKWPTTTPVCTMMLR